MRGAWRKALLEHGGAAPHGHAEGGDGVRGDVARVVVEAVTPAGERGLVTLSLHEGRLVAVDERGERGSALVAAALGWLDELAAEEGTEARGEGPLRVSIPSPAPSIDGLRDLVLALVRSGVAGARRGALDEHLRVARGLTDVRSARWTARFEAALAADDLATLACLGRGALAPAREQLGTRVDLRLVEIARERLDGVQPRRIERRYLLDLGSGEVLLEEQDVALGHGSMGPMPRVLEAGLVEVSSEPGRLVARILQYTMTPGVEPSVLARVAELAETELARAFERVERELRAGPGWAEPLVLFAPRAWEPGLRALDVEGRAVPFSADEDPAACLLLEEIVERAPPAWVAMRACPRRGAHAFVPLACAHAPEGVTTIARLRG